VLLIAERAALLSGRDDEFVAIVTMGFTGIRWGELVGLEPQYVRRDAIRVEWQLYELDNGQFERCPPKDGSLRTIAAPSWLIQLLTDHLGRISPKPCSCHGLRYVFTDHRATKSKAAPVGPRLVDVARRAEVAVGTASAVLSGKPVVAEATVVRVLAAVTELGYVRGRPAGKLAAHWRRNGFATWLSSLPPLAAIRPRLPGRPGRSRSSPTRGRVFRFGDGERWTRRTPVGCRLPPG
jgi:hypothetical protein